MKRATLQDGTKALTANETTILTLLAKGPASAEQLGRSLEANSATVQRCLRRLYDAGKVGADWWCPDDAYSPERPRRIFHVK